MFRYRLHLLLVFFAFFCSSCSHDSPISPSSRQEFNGRDNGVSLLRMPLYQGKVPKEWTRIDPPTDSSIANTMLPICEFLIGQGQQSIRLTLHTFPFRHLGERITPDAQIDRWKKQLGKIEPTSLLVSKETHGGFTGLCIEATGTKNNSEVGLLAWSMQLTSDYASRLEASSTLKADYTIKVMGAPDLIMLYRQSIQNFAHSFELINELPSP